MYTLKIRLNGTDKNPWHSFGFKQNPFPQIAKAELGPAMNAINSLNGDPLGGPDDIRKRLSGTASEELIELCCAKFRKGELVEFIITW